MLHIVNNTQQAKRLSRRYKENNVRRICQGIYTDDLKSPLEIIVLGNWMDILSHVVPHGILGYRTAVDLKPLPFRGISIVFVISSYVKTINLPGLIIKVYKGDNHQFLEQVLPKTQSNN